MVGPRWCVFPGRSWSGSSGDSAVTNEGASPRFLALMGPTAVGKTRLSFPLARELDAEIVSVDSRQVYRRMDIGTAKARPEERAAVPHHGLDRVDPSETYSAGRFARDARRWIEEIRGRGRTPLLVGGTGFFLRALTDPIVADPVVDRERRDRLRAVLRRWPREELERWVRVLDPERAPVAVEGGRQRMGRALEVALLTGRPLTWWHRHAAPDAPGVPGLVVVLHRPRPELDRRIAERVDAMLDEGLVEEVRSLLEAGYGPEAPGMTATGYREVVAHLQGRTSLEEAAEAIKRATRRYARRQLTWFRNQLPEGARWVDARGPAHERVAEVAALWRATRGERRG